MTVFPRLAFAALSFVIRNKALCTPARKNNKDQQTVRIQQNYNALNCSLNRLTLNECNYLMSVIVKTYRIDLFWITYSILGLKTNEKHY